MIPRKDLPRIYTMCLPVQYQKRNATDLQQSNDEASSLGQGLADLEKSRNEVTGGRMRTHKEELVGSICAMDAI